jgi:hypothetical protein
VEQAAKWAGVSVHFLKELVRKRKNRIDLDRYLEKLHEQQRKGRKR